MNEIFEKYAENAFDTDTKEHSLSWKKKWYDANFKKFFPRELTARLLDVGPGLGELLITEREWGYQNCYAIDISSSVIHHCKKKGLQCEIVEDTASWLRSHEESFDMITVLDVFEHIPLEHTLDFLRACKKALSENGILILQVPNIQSPEGYLHRYNDITHVFGYSQHTLDQLFTTVGFETVKFYPFEEYPGDDPDTKMKRRLRSIYWRGVRANRVVTHNLDAEILTPELFAVVAKRKCELPQHQIEDAFADRVIGLKDMNDYLKQLGAGAELFEKINHIDELEMLLQNQKNNYLEKWKELEERLEVLYVKLDEQEERLVQFVDRHLEKLNEHNVQAQGRLDYIEMKLEKMDRLLMNMRKPLRTFLRKIRRDK